MMAAVVRVKRLLDEEPSEGLILSCKRRKTSVAVEDSVKTVFKFAGTVNDPDEDISKFISADSKRNSFKNLSRQASKLLEKARNETKLSSQKNRYKLVNCSRSLADPDHSKKEQESELSRLTVLDVESEKQGNTNDEPEARDANPKCSNDSYVYDLYCMQPESDELDVDDLLLDGLVSFAPVEGELVFHNYRNNRVGGEDSDSDSPVADDEDDSNDENNWRNDYPDEEGGSDAEDNSLAAGFKTITFGDEELSSDDDDEKLIYSEQLDLHDVNTFGVAYAHFKKTALHELKSDEEVISDSDDFYTGSAHSSDSDENAVDRYD